VGFFLCRPPHRFWRLCVILYLYSKMAIIVLSAFFGFYKFLLFCYFCSAPNTRPSPAPFLRRLLGRPPYLPRLPSFELSPFFGVSVFIPDILVRPPSSRRRPPSFFCGAAARVRLRLKSKFLFSLLGEWISRTHVFPRRRISAGQSGPYGFLFSGG